MRDAAVLARLLGLAGACVGAGITLLALLGTALLRAGIEGVGLDPSPLRAGAAAAMTGAPVLSALAGAALAGQRPRLAASLLGLAALVWVWLGVRDPSGWPFLLAADLRRQPGHQTGQGNAHKQRPEAVGLRVIHAVALLPPRPPPPPAAKRTGRGGAPRTPAMIARNAARVEGAGAGEPGGRASRPSGGDPPRGMTAADGHRRLRRGPVRSGCRGIIPAGKACRTRSAGQLVLPFRGAPRRRRCRVVRARTDHRGPSPNVAAQPPDQVDRAQPGSGCHRDGQGPPPRPVQDAGNHPAPAPCLTADFARCEDHLSVPPICAKLLGNSRKFNGIPDEDVRSHHIDALQSSPTRTSSRQ
jgi:hypothetical protein